MTLDRFIRLHAVLCTAHGVADPRWFAQMLEYDAACLAFQRHGIDWKQALRRAHGFTIAAELDEDVQNGIEIKRRYRQRLGRSVARPTSRRAIP